MKKLVSLLLCIAMLGGVCLFAVSCDSAKTNDTAATTAPETTASPEEEKYAQALALLESRNYEEAKALFEELGDYEDAEEHLAKFQYFPTLIQFRLTDVSGKLEISLNENNLPAYTVSDTTNPGKRGELVYDEKGQVIRQIVDVEGEGTYTFDYTRDANGNMTKALYTGPNGEWYAYHYKYNEKDLLTEECGEDAEGISYVYTIEYDENWHDLRAEYAEGGELIFSYDYTYDANGNMSRRVQKYGDEVAFAIDFTRDANGNVIKEVYSEGADGVVAGTSEYTYDENGRQIKAVYTDGEGYVETLLSTYDEHGNLIKEECSDTEGSVQFVETQYVLTYIPFVYSEAYMAYLSTFWNVKG